MDAGPHHFHPLLLPSEDKLQSARAFFRFVFFSLLFTNHNNSSRHALFFSSYTSAIFIQGSCETDQLTTNTIIMPSIHLVSAFLQILKSFFNSLNIKREENKKCHHPPAIYTFALRYFLKKQFEFA